MRYQFGISRPEWFVVPVRLCTWAESSVRCSPGGTAEPMSYSFSRPCAGMKKRHLRIFPYQGTPGAPSFALFAKGGIPRISIPTVAYPTLCKERKGWGTRLFAAPTTVPNTTSRFLSSISSEKSRIRPLVMHYMSRRRTMSSACWLVQARMCSRSPPKRRSTTSVCLPSVTAT
jgi:hypothetical protein